MSDEPLLGPCWLCCAPVSPNAYCVRLLPFTRELVHECMDCAVDRIEIRADRYRPMHQMHLRASDVKRWALDTAPTDEAEAADRWLARARDPEGRTLDGLVQGR